MRVTYDLDYLEEKGFFETSRKLKDEYSSGKEIEYKFDPENKLAYFEDFDRDEISEIVKGLKKKRNFDYFWFWEEGRLAAFRRFGENKKFIFNLKYAKHRKTEYLKSKRKKLREFSLKNPSSLFDIKDVIDYFYSRLWKIRIKLARSIQNEIPDKEKILVTQRIIDRLIFIYFLGEKGVMKGKNKGGNYFQINFKGLATHVVEDSSDFFEWLKSLFFNFLNDTEENLMGIPGEEEYFLDIPYLNGGIFREKTITTCSGREIGESEIEINGFEWKELVSELNNYNWIIEPYDVAEDEDVVGNLTPEILGHIYEKFVITLSKTPLDEIDIERIKTTKKGELKSGRKKIGGYYTPEEITKYIAENTIFSFLKDKMNLENSDNFDDFYEAHRNDKEKMKEVDEILSDIKVLDPAVGSGHFLMSAADLLADWRKKCGAGITDYSLRKNIIINNLYGVDIMEGAVEICKLRLWLWLVAGIKLGEVKKEVKLEPLPNIDYNFMVGNSLIGFIEPPEEKVLGEDVVLRPKKVGQKTLGSEKQMALEKGKSAAQIMKERKRLIEKYKTTAKGAGPLKGKIEKKCAPLREKLNEKLLSRFRDFMDITDEEFEELKPFHWCFEFYEVFNSENPEERGFEIVIGNPPYVDYRSMNEIERDIVKETYVSTDVKAKWSSYIPFVERSLNLIEESGKFCFIMPQKWLSAKIGRGLIDFVLDNYSFYEIVDLLHTDQPIFQGQSYSNLGLFFIGKGNSEDVIVKYDVQDYSSLADFKGKHLDCIDDIVLKARDTPIIIPSASREVIRKIIDASFINSICLEDVIELEWGTSASYGKKLAEKEENNHLSFLQTSDIHRYETRWQGYYMPESFYSERKLELFSSDKIVITRRSPRLRATMDRKGSVLGKVAFSVDIKISEVSPMYILVILNSKLFDFLFKKIFESQHPGGSFQYDIPYLNVLPIKISDVYKKLGILCDYMMFLKDKMRKNTENEIIKFIDRKVIDSLIYELYFKRELKTNLLQFVESYLKDIRDLKSDKEKMKTIKLVVEKIKADDKFIGESEKIKNHRWVKVIEGRST